MSRASGSLGCWSHAETFWMTQLPTLGRRNTALQPPHARNPEPASPGQHPTGLPRWGTQLFCLFIWEAASSSSSSGEAATLQGARCLKGGVLAAFPSPDAEKILRVAAKTWKCITGEIRVWLQAQEPLSKGANWLLKAVFKFFLPDPTGRGEKTCSFPVSLLIHLG